MAMLPAGHANGMRLQMCNLFWPELGAMACSDVEKAVASNGNSHPKGMKHQESIAGHSVKLWLLAPLLCCFVLTKNIKWQGPTRMSKQTVMSWALAAPAKHMSSLTLQSWLWLHSTSMLAVGNETFSSSTDLRQCQTRINCNAHLYPHSKVYSYGKHDLEGRKVFFNSWIDS